MKEVNEENTSDGFILICIPTCMRLKMLTACLESIAATKLPKANEVRLLVLDNDVLKSAESVFAAQHFSFPARYVVQAQRGLCSIRNRALDEAKAAGAAYLAFIDDDHQVDENWLCALLEDIENCGADVISGRAEYIYPAGGKPWWMPAEKTTTAHGIKTNQKGIETAFSLFRARVFEKLRFDMRFNLTGAEDYNYSLRAIRQGFSLASTDRAQAKSPLPAVRMTFRSYFLTQWQRQTSYVLSHRLVDGFGKSLHFLPKGVIKFCKGILYCVVGLLLGKKVFTKGIKNIIAGSGLCYGVFAHGSYEKYTKIEGE